MSIIGTWRFNKTITNTFETNYFAYVGFKCGDVTYEVLSIVGYSDNKPVIRYSAEDVGDYNVYDFTSSLWTGESSRIIEILSEYEDETFTTWLKANAQKIPETIAEKLTLIAENEPKVFNAGKQAEYDAFWDVYQQNGTRKDYSLAFGGKGWTDEFFKPKYPIVCDGHSAVYQMFAQTKITTIPEGLIDTSKVANLNYMFYRPESLEYAPTIDASSATAMTGLCQNAVTLKKVGIENITSGCSYEVAFENCISLTDLHITGTLGKNRFNVQWCPLTTESLLSILNALEDKSGDTSGTSWTVTFGSKNLAKLTTGDLSTAWNKGWDVV